MIAHISILAVATTDTAVEKQWLQFIFYSPLAAALATAFFGSGLIWLLVNRSIERLKNSLTAARDLHAQKNRVYLDAVTAYQKEATSLEAIALEAYNKLQQLAADAPQLADNKTLIHRAALALEAFSRFTIGNNEEFKLLTRRHTPDVVDAFDYLTTDFCSVFILLSSDPVTRATQERQQQITEALERMHYNLTVIEQRIAQLSP